MMSLIQSDNEDHLEKENDVRQRITRPLGVTLLALLVFLASMLYFSRFIQVIQEWDFISSLLPFSPIYLVLSGLLLGIVGLTLFWGLWRGKSWASLFTVFGILFSLLFYWVDRLFMPGYVGRNFNWLFAAGFCAFIVVISWWVLTRSRTKEFFGGGDE